MYYLLVGFLIAVPIMVVLLSLWLCARSKRNKYKKMLDIRGVGLSKDGAK